jgi:hypothetical protein
MRKITACICITALLIVFTAEALAQEQTQPKVLRVGFEKAKPLNNLDMFGSKPAYDIEAFASQKPVQNVSMLSRTAPKEAFNASQRTGMVAKFTSDTGIFKPLFNVSAYSMVKPIYDVPSSVRNKPVYNIENYPKIKAVNSIP